MPLTFDKPLHELRNDTGINPRPAHQGRNTPWHGAHEYDLPPSTQFSACNKITAPKELVLYPDFGHEGLPGHDDRIFGFLLKLKSC